METLFSILHVVTAVFIVGPMAILPMTAMRAVRAGNASQVAVLAKSTNLFSLLSLLVVVFGFGVMGMADEKYNLSVTTPWVLWSIILYIVALGLSLFVVVPTMRKAAEALGAVDAANPAAAAAPSRYPAIAAGSGVASLLLVAVVVLMVWKP
ncbi:DUF2269 family protein [Microterricola viridarii]|uniref:Uncharacterized membrane protein n=1 Tax=Microterricola viridarii TaxID=412690 RepID=A0A1H1QN45_9MICO|nr:DUF2269 family protein [Microterricola viridarii]SDS24796.1 Uncharacterized membrane protein [Microterricola viridarii]